MVKVVFVDAAGVEHERDLRPGISLMEGAVRTGVPGIDGDCGGACACGTCQVQVEAGWLDALPPPSETETCMLEFAQSAQANSRLACQITVLDLLDGLRVSVPPTQG